MFQNTVCFIAFMQKGNPESMCTLRGWEGCCLRAYKSVLEGGG